MVNVNGSRLVSLCLDANDPLRLARFWAEALRWKVDETDDEIGLVPTDGTRFGILFEPVPEPKVGRNRLHLDLTTISDEDQQESVERLVELGARHIDVGQGPDDRHVVLADPEGNEFCIIEPENNFLADCGRLGSITCDGTREVGYFWSAALGWPLVWDQDDETAIRAPGPYRSDDHLGWRAACTEGWEEPASPLDIAPPADVDQQAEVDRLVSLGREADRYRPRPCQLGGHGRSRRQRVLCVESPIAGRDVLRCRAARRDLFGPSTIRDPRSGG